MTWEAHNCTLRGELIKMGTQRKRERDNDITRLTDKIARLEALHKQSLMTASASELLDTRKTLQQLFEAKAKRFLFFRKKNYHIGHHE